MKLKKLSEGFRLNFILIEMLAIKSIKKCIFKLKGRTKFLLMFPKEILMICLGKRDSMKSRRIPNQKGEILERK